MMQRFREKVITRLQVGGGGCLWVAGLMLAGSDGPYMPWLNGLGLLVFMGASLALGRILPDLGKPKGALRGPKSPARTLVPVKKCRKLNTRIALGV